MSFKRGFLLIIILSLQFFPISAKNYYVSSTQGNDSHTVTQAQNPSTPWKTISRINSFLKTAKPGDSILFNRGDTFYGSILLKVSGSLGNPIVFGAYGTGEKPIITGFTNVTDWTNLGNNIWESKSEVSNLPYSRVVSIDRKNIPMGRYPNVGYLSYQSHNGNISISSNSLTGSVNWTGAEIVLKKEKWAIETGLIKRHSGNTIEYTDGNLYVPTDGFGFFIQNDIKTLDQQNEWYYNPSTKKLSIYSINRPINVRIATIENLVDSGWLPGEGDNVIFRNISFIGSNSNAIYLINKKNVTIENCNIFFTGMQGVHTLGVPNIKIENNSFDYINGNAVRLSETSINALVSKNKIKNSGMVAGAYKDYPYGAISVHGKNSIVQYNNVDSSGYNGIMFYGNNTVVKNNLINNSCLILDDGAGIYTDGHANQTGKKITGNIILNSIGNAEGTNNKSDLHTIGIYLDESASNVTVSGNTIFNSSCAGIFLHSAHDIIIDENTVFDNGSAGYFSGGIVLSQTMGRDLIRNNIITNNTIISKSIEQPLVQLSSNADDANLFAFLDNNVYASPMQQGTMFTIRERSSFQIMNLKKWKNELNQDINSTQSKSKIPRYLLNKLLGQNQIASGTFEDKANLANISSYAVANNIKTNYDGSGKIDGIGSLKVSFTKETTSKTQMFIKFAGGTNSNNHYLIKFSALPESERVVGLSFRQSKEPYQFLTPAEYITIPASRSDNEVLISFPENEPDACIVLELNSEDGPLWLDNIELYRVDVNMINPDDHIRFEYNATNKAKTIKLDRPYVDAKGTPYQTNVTLQPWTSAVLIATDKPAEKTSQSISFPALQDRNYDDFPFELRASSSSGLAVLYNIISGPAVVSGNQVAVTGFGTVTIEASQPGDSNYAAASPVTRSFNVIKSDIDNRNAQELLRINSGGPSFYFGNEQWAADKYFEGGKVYQVSNRDISNTDNDVLYLSERYGNFSYMLPVPEVALYKVELYFAEIHWNRSNARIFDLEIENGQYTMDNIDLYKIQGRPNAASVYVAENIEVTDGFLNINLNKRKDNAKISGIVLYKQMGQPNFKLAQPQIASFNNEIAELWESHPNLEKTEVKLYPNPTREKLFIDFVVEKPGVWEIVLVNPTGTSILLGNRNLELGKHTLAFDLSAYQLSAGSYFLRLTNERSQSKVVGVIIF